DRMLASPLPFGVHRFPDLESLQSTNLGLYVSIAFRRSPFSRRDIVFIVRILPSLVSIAFRRSPFSRRRFLPRYCNPRPFCLHCLSAFTVFPTNSRPDSQPETAA